MQDSNLMPLLSFKTNDLFNEKEQFIVKYLQGSPRQYRFNMSSAVVSLNGMHNVTQPKDDFTFAPFAYRYFEDSLFGKEEKAWVELFFLNEAKHVCSIMFHGYTASAFKQHYADFMFYDDLDPTEVIFTVRPEEKTVELTEGDKKVSKKYFIGSWKSKKIDSDTREASSVLIDCLLPVYREDTYKENRLSMESKNYKLNPSQNALLLAEKAKQKWTDELLESLDTPPSESSESAAATSRVLAAGRKGRVLKRY